MGGKGSGKGRVLGSKNEKVHWEVFYFDSENKRTINEHFKTMDEILEFPGLEWLKNRWQVDYYKNTNGKNKKGILIKKIESQKIDLPISSEEN